METASRDERAVFSVCKSSRFATMARYTAPLILLAGDYLAVIAALSLACFLRESVLPHIFPHWPVFKASTVYIFVSVPMVYLFFFLYDGSYTRRLPLWQGVERVFRICTYVGALAIMLMYFLGKAEQISRLVVGMTWVFSIFSLALMRVTLKRILVHIGLWQRPVILVGAGRTAELLYQAFHKDKGLGYEIVGVIEDAWQERPLARKVPCLGTFQQAETVVQESGVKDVVLAVPGIPREQLLELMYRLQPHVRNLTIVPDLFGVPMGNMTVDTLFDQKTVLLRVHNNLLRQRNRVFKRIFDISACLIGGLLLLPALAVLALIICASSSGPAIFAHTRIGEHGKPFSCYKFRTMVCNGEEVLTNHFAQHPEAKVEWERDFKLKEDPRVTKIGAWLRKTSLDELPQLLNVLRGEMSLVGPRPIIEAEVSRYEEYIQDYYIVKPGITGLWQVSGRNDIDYPERVRMDSWYVRNWSVWLDLILLAKTIGVVAARKGAY